METRKGELGPGMVGPPPAMPGQPAPMPAPMPMPMPAPAPAPVAAASMSAPSTEVALRAAKGGNRTWLWLVVGLIVLGGAVGAVLALTM
jgi:hypothetical protein